jgi:hypothetical protein
MSMKKAHWGIALAALTLAAGAPGTASAVEQRLGVGANYWHTINEIKDADKFDRDGVSWYVSYQLKPVWLLFLDLQVEQMPEGFMASDKAVYAPQAYVGVEILFLYGALGIGKYFADETDEVFYAVRAGVNLNLLPFLGLDIYGNYRFGEWNGIEERKNIDTDTVTVGAAVRLEF